MLLLWTEATAKGYSSPSWMTFKQAQELRAHVRKGEHGSMVVYADRFTKTDINDKGEEVEREIPFLKAYTVFNVEQIDGLPERYTVAPIETRPERLTLIEASEEFFHATGAAFRHRGGRAFYATSQDYIQLPPPEAFRDAQSYASTKAHELTH